MKLKENVKGGEKILVFGFLKLFVFRLDIVEFERGKFVFFYICLFLVVVMYSCFLFFCFSKLFRDFIGGNYYL